MGDQKRKNKPTPFGGQVAVLMRANVFSRRVLTRCGVVWGIKCSVHIVNPARVHRNAFSVSA